MVFAITLRGRVRLWREEWRQTGRGDRIFRSIVVLRDEEDLSRGFHLADCGDDRAHRLFGVFLFHLSQIRHLVAQALRHAL